MLWTLKQREAVSNLGKVGRFPLVTFEPSPVFTGFIAEIALNKKILIRAANRVGKTRHVAWVVAKSMVDNPGFRARVVGPTADHVHNVLGKYLAEFLGPYLAPGSYHIEGKGWNGGRARVIRLRNGSMCDLKSLKDHPEAHSGVSCHLIAFDEPPTLAHFTENSARLVDTNGTMIIAATMVNRPCAWLRDLVQGSEADPGSGRTKHGSGWLQIVASFSKANCPWYSDEQIAEWNRTMELTPWERGQRLDAAWDGVTASRLFAGVRERCFTTEPPPGSLHIGLGIDHGDVAGHQAAILVAFKGTTIFVLDEYRSLTATTPEQDSEAILAMLERRRIPPTAVDLAVGDIGHVRGYTGYKINDAMQTAMAGLTGSSRPPFPIQYPDKTPGSVDFGQRCINYAGVRGDLRIHPRCLHLTQSIRHWKGGRKHVDGELSHIADSLRYILTTAIGHHTQYAKLRFA